MSNSEVLMRSDADDGGVRRLRGNFAHLRVVAGAELEEHPSAFFVEYVGELCVLAFDIASVVALAHST